MTVYYDADRVQPGAFPALLAIGDSWFWYPFVSNLLAEISAVVKPDYSNILTLGKVGATLEQFAVGRHAPQLARQLRPQNIIYYSALLVSGGGNDAVDWGLCLKRDCTGLQTAEECLDEQKLAEKMTELGGWFLAIVNEVRSGCEAIGRPRMDVFVHCYDYAPPNGEPARFPPFGVPVQGPWLKPAMDAAKVDPNDFELRQDIVRVLIDALADAFGEFDSPADKVHVVRSPGTLDPATDWANELHPNGDGFRKLVHGPWSEALKASGYVP